MPLQPGFMLNKRYRIIQLLGQGGFGAVYSALDTTFDISCAVKENLDNAPESVLQFEREASMLRSLRHPNLVQVLDYFSIPGVEGCNGYNQTAPIGSFPSGISPYGLFDADSNVWQWVLNWYDADYYGQSPRDNPSGPEVGQFRILRGGSWFNPASFRFSHPKQFNPDVTWIIHPNDLRTVNRGRYLPSSADFDKDFRCARSQ
jgi:hypothetical protein